MLAPLIPDRPAIFEQISPRCLNQPTLFGSAHDVGPAHDVSRPFVSIKTTFSNTQANKYSKCIRFVYECSGLNELIGTCTHLCLN